MGNEMGFEEILSSVVGNEELMSKISKIVSSHKDDESSSLGEVIEEISSNLGKSKENDDVVSEDFKEEKASEASKTSESRLKIPTLSRKNHDLLCALKPFMSKRRQDMIDSILKLEQMSEIAKLVR